MKDVSKKESHQRRKKIRTNPARGVGGGVVGRVKWGGGAGRWGGGVRRRGGAGGGGGGGGVGGGLFDKHLRGIWCPRLWGLVVRSEARGGGT